ncbi:hypothetical protein ACJZ2D_005435 [Fusarium nematophilum]
MADSTPNHALDHESRVSSVIALSAATSAISTIVVVLRVYSRAVIGRCFGMDDWFILAAGIFAIGTSFTVPYRTEFGLGRHSWLAEEWMTIPHMKVFYASIILYNCTLITVKMSFLFFYRRVFPDSRLRKVCLWFILGNGIWGAAALGMSFVPCLPVNGFWDFSVPATCIPSVVDWYLQSLVMIITDFAILVLPLPSIWKLNTTRREKIVILSCFSVGFLTCLISILRLYSLEVAADSTDPNWNYVDAAMWSVAECNVAVFCACLPTLRPLLKGFRERLLKSSKASSHSACDDVDLLRVPPNEAASEVSHTSNIA